MDLGERSQVVLREDVSLMKNQLNQLKEAMSALVHIKDNIRWTTVTKNVIPSPTSGPA